MAEWSERQRRNMENEPAGLAAFVATVRNEVVGWAAWGRNREQGTEYGGELFTVYLLTCYWRRGIGRLLMKAAAQSLIKQGMDSMILWVLAENCPARSFYQALDGQYVRERTINIGGVAQPEVSYGWANLSILAHIGGCCSDRT